MPSQLEKSLVMIILLSALLPLRLHAADSKANGPINVEGVTFESWTAYFTAGICSSSKAKATASGTHPSACPRINGNLVDEKEIDMDLRTES